MDRSTDWMAQAKRDLEHARADVERGFFEWACFSAQQAAEKGVKAVLMGRGAETWGHSVAALLRAIGGCPEPLVDAALELDKGYIPARYPDAHPAGHPGALFTASEARRFVAHAEAILGHCAGLLAALDAR